MRATPVDFQAASRTTAQMALQIITLMIGGELH
jgi:hypothetical protein